MTPADQTESLYQKGVKHLCDNGISSVPDKYILPVSERPRMCHQALATVAAKDTNLKLPIIDFSEMCGPNRARVIESLANACQEHGFFQVVNHGIGVEVIRSMIDVSTRFFELPYEERAKYMSPDMSSTVRYGTSFNQTKDSVFCWRDFLKLVCNPMSDHWPSSPVDFRELAGSYAEETKKVYKIVMEAMVESLGLKVYDEETKKMIKELGDGSQVMVVNCYPPCPEPALTLGMPPHSDYGFLTLLLQDDVQGLQIHRHGNWVTVDPIANSLLVNVGDHLEILSNGRYKSVLHRVLTNSRKNRISVASLHSLPFSGTAKPFPGLISQATPPRYMDTNFDHFLTYLKSCEPKGKSFLQTRKLSSNTNGCHVKYIEEV